MRDPLCLRRRKRQLDGVAPENNELGVMLPYTPLHHLLFAAGAPDDSGDDERESLERTDRL